MKLKVLFLFLPFAQTSLLIGYNSWLLDYLVPPKLERTFPFAVNIGDFNQAFESYELLTNSVLAGETARKAFNKAIGVEQMETVNVEGRELEYVETETEKVQVELLVHLISSELFKLPSSETLAQVIVCDYANYPMRFDLILRYLHNNNNSNVIRRLKKVIGISGSDEMQKIVKFLYFGTINKLVSELEMQKAKEEVMKYLIARPRMLDAVLSVFAPIHSFIKTSSVIDDPVLDAAIEAAFGPKENEKRPWFFNAQDFLYLYKAASSASLTETLECLFKGKFYPLLHQVFPLLDSSIKSFINLKNLDVLKILLNPKIYVYSKLPLDDSIMDLLVNLHMNLPAELTNLYMSFSSDDESSDEADDNGATASRRALAAAFASHAQKQSANPSVNSSSVDEGLYTLESIIINLLQLPVKITIQQLDSLIVSRASANLIEAFIAVLSKKFNVLNQSIILGLLKISHYILAEAIQIYRSGNFNKERKKPLISTIDSSVLKIGLEYYPEIIPHLITPLFVPCLIDLSYDSYEALILAIQMDSQEFIQAFYSLMHLSVVRGSIEDPFVRAKIEQKASKLTKEVIMRAFHEYDNKQRVNANKDLASQ